MADSFVQGSLTTMNSGTSQWIKDVEVVGEGIGLDFSDDAHAYSSRMIGSKGEDIAALFMERMGIEILERNWRCSLGEVDIIAREGDTILLVEVKTRSLHALRIDDEPIPELAVGSRKRGKYEKLALIYLSKKPQYDSVRFDVVAVKLIDSNTARVRYMAGAYEWDW